jgi:L-alanine-DL-glutamate epimerase-like enolase superfamily enzyme
MALWDLCGKAAGQPLYRLFGGAQRQFVDYFCYLSRGTPDSLADQSRAGLARGHTCFYLKVGVDRAAETAMLAAIRDTVGPAAKLRIDANEAWSLPQAVDILNDWHGRFHLDFAEAPVRVTPEIMRDLKARTPVALCANEGLETPQQVARIITSRAADVLCFSSFWVGSLRRVLTLSHMAELEGITICKHTHGELGLAAAAGQHLMLAIPNASDGAQQTATVTADDILTEPLPIATGARWGRIEAPGLGVEVDPDKLARYAEAFRRNGQFRPYGERVPEPG